MQLSSKVRMNRLFNNGKCLDVAIDHGIANEPDFLIGLEDIERVMNSLIVARPDAIQVNYGQADLLQCSTQRDKPALVMRTDVGNAYNARVTVKCGRCCIIRKRRSSPRCRWMPRPWW
jgi:fructose-bisphosphate aldolase, class I